MKAQNRNVTEKTGAIKHLNKLIAANIVSLQRLRELPTVIIRYEYLPNCNVKSIHLAMMEISK